MKVDAKVLLFCEICKFHSKKIEKNLVFSALGIGRATVLCNNAELVNPCKAGRSQDVCAAGTAKGCSHPPEVVLQPPAGRVKCAAAWSGRTNVTEKTVDRR